MEQTERSPQAVQTERIWQMERRLDRASQAVMRLSAALYEYAVWNLLEDVRDLKERIREMVFNNAL
ncbi:MAG: hypothetical protein IJ533_07760 [Prevotella sp.]|nr:hypothetical protein [Prevotella sp.]